MLGAVLQRIEADCMYERDGIDGSLGLEEEDWGKCEYLITIFEIRMRGKGSPYRTEPLFSRS